MNKKVILAFVLGVLISGVSVYAATNYLASEIVYNDTTVENALNELYNRSNSEEYHVGNAIIPAETEQVFQTNGKRLDGNITVSAIPDYYKKLNNHTTVDASKLLDGVTAYNEYGEFITGNISTNCTKTAYVWTQNDATSGSKTILDYKPTYLMFSDNNNVIYYNANANANTMIRIGFGDNGIYNNNNTVNYVYNYGLTEWKIKINSNNVKFEFGSERVGQTLYYVACK